MLRLKTNRFVLQYLNINLIKKLRQTINVYNKEKSSFSKKQRIILIGDSNIKEYVFNLKPLLSSNYELYSVVKPGSTTSELKKTAKKEINQLSHDDLIVICSGTNDYELNELSLTLRNVTDFIKNNNRTNIIPMNGPFRYDLPYSISVNMNISGLNGKLQKLVKVFPMPVSWKRTIVGIYLLIMDYTLLN
jgi:hypothetical protein